MVHIPGKCFPNRFPELIFLPEIQSHFPLTLPTTFRKNGKRLKIFQKTDKSYPGIISYTRIHATRYFVIGHLRNALNSIVTSIISRYPNGSHSFAKRGDVGARRQ